MRTLVVVAILVSHWSLGLLPTTSGVLLDGQGPESIRHRIKHSIGEDEESKVAELHLWSIGPNIYAAVITIVAHNPATADQYRERIPKGLGLVHISIEVHKFEKDASREQDVLAATST